MREIRVAPLDRNERLASIYTPSSYNESNVSKNITRMVIISSFLRILGDLPLLFAVVFVSVGSSSVSANIVFYIAGILLFLSPTFDFLVYYFFNKHYRSALNGYVRKFQHFIRYRRFH